MERIKTEQSLSRTSTAGEQLPESRLTSTISHEQVTNSFLNNSNFKPIRQNNNNNKNQTQTQTQNEKLIQSIHGPGPHVVNPNVQLQNDAYLIQLRQCMHCLKNCDWYKGRLSKKAAKDILKRCRPGSFLLRDSDNPLYLFSLSQNLHFVGPIATRIFFQDGLFWFDDGRRPIASPANFPGNKNKSPDDINKNNSRENLIHTNELEINPKDPNNNNNNSEISQSSNKSGVMNINGQPSIGFSCVVSLIEHWAKMYINKNIMALRYPLKEDNTPNLDGLNFSHKCTIHVSENILVRTGSQQNQNFINQDISAISSSLSNLVQDKDLASLLQNEHSPVNQNQVITTPEQEKKSSNRKSINHKQKAQSHHNSNSEAQNQKSKIDLQKSQSLAANPQGQHQLIPKIELNGHKKLEKMMATPVINNNVPIGVVPAVPQIMEHIMDEGTRELLSNKGSLGFKLNSEFNRHINPDIVMTDSQHNNANVERGIQTTSSLRRKESKISNHNQDMSVIAEISENNNHQNYSSVIDNLQANNNNSPTKLIRPKAHKPKIEPKESNKTLVHRSAENSTQENSTTNSSSNQDNRTDQGGLNTMPSRMSQSEINSHTTNPLNANNTNNNRGILQQTLSHPTNPNQNFHNNPQSSNFVRTGYLHNSVVRNPSSGLGQTSGVHSGGSNSHLTMIREQPGSSSHPHQAIDRIANEERTSLNFQRTGSSNTVNTINGMKLAPANTITCPHCANLIMIPFYTTDAMNFCLNNNNNNKQISNTINQNNTNESSNQSSSQISPDKKSIKNDTSSDDNNLRIAPAIPKRQILKVQNSTQSSIGPSASQIDKSVTSGPEKKENLEKNTLVGSQKTCIDNNQHLQQKHNSQNQIQSDLNQNQTPNTSLTSYDLAIFQAHMNQQMQSLYAAQQQLTQLTHTLHNSLQLQRFNNVQTQNSMNAANGGGFLNHIQQNLMLATGQSLQTFGSQDRISQNTLNNSLNNNNNSNNSATINDSKSKSKSHSKSNTKQTTITDNSGYYNTRKAIISSEADAEVLNLPTKPKTTIKDKNRLRVSSRNAHQSPHRARAQERLENLGTRHHYHGNHKNLMHNNNHISSLAKPNNTNINGSSSNHNHNHHYRNTNKDDSELNSSPGYHNLPNTGKNIDLAAYNMKDAPISTFEDSDTSFSVGLEVPDILRVNRIKSELQQHSSRADRATLISPVQNRQNVRSGPPLSPIILPRKEIVAQSKNSFKNSSNKTSKSKMNEKEAKFSDSETNDTEFDESKAAFLAIQKIKDSL